MNKISFVLSLIAVAALSQADLRSEITAARHKVERATLAKDAKGAEAAYKESVTSDFKYIQGGQTQDFKTFVANFTAGFAMMDKITSSSSRIISLKENGRTGVGQVELDMTATTKTPGKKAHSIRYAGIFTMEYRKVDGKWKTATMTAGAQKFLMDGKPVKM